MTAKDPSSENSSPTRAQKLREQIKEIIGERKNKSGDLPRKVPEDHPAQPRSLNEIIEDRMRDHVGEKKP